jgi:hypothetical protein
MPLRQSTSNDESFEKNTTGDTIAVILPVAPAGAGGAYLPGSRNVYPTLCLSKKAA